MNFVCIVFELGDKMLTLSSMENLIVQCNLLALYLIKLQRLVIFCRAAIGQNAFYAYLTTYFLLFYANF